MMRAQALESIQDMANHSHKWHDRESPRKTNNDSSDGIVAITNKLYTLVRNIKKLKDNIHAIQVACENCKEMHLDKERTLDEEVKRVKEKIKLEIKEVKKEVVSHKLRHDKISKPPTRLKENDRSWGVLPYLGVSVNIMPFSMFKRLEVTNLKETTMLVEMTDMYNKAPRGIVKNMLVKINKFVFPSDFVVVDMVGRMKL
ncbi:putative reverse transcriptase domain-containing protein [Tanacetum coccineum]